MGNGQGTIHPTQTFRLRFFLALNLRDSDAEENVSVNVFFQYVMTRHPQQANRVAAKIDNLLHSLQIFSYIFNNVEKTKSAHLPQGQVPDIFQLVNVIVSVIVSFLFTKLQRSFLKRW